VIWRVGLPWHLSPDPLSRSTKVQIDGRIETVPLSKTFASPQSSVRTRSMIA
jgi:hypothetical protein